MSYYVNTTSFSEVLQILCDKLGYSPARSLRSVFGRPDLFATNTHNNPGNQNLWYE